MSVSRLTRDTREVRGGYSGSAAKGPVIAPLSSGANVTPEPVLTDASLKERQRAVEHLLRDKPEDGPVLLSYVAWPDAVPSLDVIEFAVRRRRLRDQRKRAA